MSKPLSLRTLRLALALMAMLGSLACGVQEPAENEASEQPLVPADAAALESYLKNAVAQHLPSTRALPVFDTTTAAPGAPGGGESGSASGFSTTTLQTAGVDEADLVKFDGETLFVARQAEYHYPVPLPGPMPVGEPVGVALFAPVPPGEPDIEPASVAVYAAHADPAEADLLTTIPLPESGTIDGMMLLPALDSAPPLLVVVGSGSTGGWYGGVRPAFDALYYYGDGHVRVWIFDVSESGEPVAIHRSKLEGSLVAVRRIGEQLVLVTRSTPYVPYMQIEGTEFDEAKPVAELSVQDLLPRRWLELPEEPTPRPLVRPEDCFVPKMRTDVDPNSFYHPTLVTISTIDLRNPDELVSICAAGPADRVYSSTRALYLASTSWSRESETLVHKFAYTERGPEFRGSGRAAGVPGGSDPDFGLGEIDGVFGIMTTVSSRTPEGGFDSAPRLTLLAEADHGSRKLEEISHLPNDREPGRIGKPGEQLYAVRFIGHRVYAVTFRRIDPLYVIDVEDPRSPFIAGELEIPGFADRLEALTPNLLLGIGKDSIEDGGVDWFQGVKVELFDVSDPSDPKSVDALVIGRRGSETAARTDHHALTTLDMGDGSSRVAIPISVADGTTGAGEAEDPRAWHAWSRTGLHLFEVDHDAPAIDQTGALIVAEVGDEGGMASTWRDRSRLQGSAVHYVHDGEVWSAPWDAPEDATLSD